MEHRNDNTRNGYVPNPSTEVPTPEDAIRWIRVALTQYWGNHLTVEQGTVHHTIEHCHKYYKITTVLSKPNEVNLSESSHFRQNHNFTLLRSLTLSHCRYCHTIWYPLQVPAYM